MFLLDTCVISEGARPRPAPAVDAWMTSQDPSSLFISVLSLGEMHFGVARLTNTSRQRALHAWVTEVESRFANRIVIVDDVVARQWGYLRAETPSAPVVDMQLAATAIAHGFTFVTRNVKDFRFDGLAVINPWEHA